MTEQEVARLAKNFALWIVLLGCVPVSVLTLVLLQIATCRREEPFCQNSACVTGTCKPDGKPTCEAYGDG